MEPIRKKTGRPDKADGVADPHVRVPFAAMDSPAWQALSPTAMALYMDGRRLLGPSNNGDLAFTPKSLRSKARAEAGEKCRWNRSDTTLVKALNELQDLGFIARTRTSPGVRNGVPEPNLYRFVDRSTYAIPAKGVPATRPTNDYLRFATLREAREYLEKVNAERDAAKVSRPKTARTAPASRGKTALHILECDAPENGVSAHKNTPDSGGPPPKTLQILETGENHSEELKQPP